MASKLTCARAVATAVRPARSAAQAQFVRCIASTASRSEVNMPKDVSNMRHAPRDHPKKLEAPLVNPADKFQSKADNLHRYGAWLMSCMPKYVQQFSVWKDELVIYIPPAGVIPVFSFLKCTSRTALGFFCVRLSITSILTNH